MGQQIAIDRTAFEVKLHIFLKAQRFKDYTRHENAPLVQLVNHLPQVPSR